jgi:hypothetical protein
VKRFTTVELVVLIGLGMSREAPSRRKLADHDFDNDQPNTNSYKLAVLVIHLTGFQYS